MVRGKNQKQRVRKVQSDKLKNFPKVYYISLEECVDRRQSLEKQFSEYGIVPTGVISKKWKDSSDVVEGAFTDLLDGGTKGSLVSHMKMLQKWYEESTDEWGFFCEDDISLKTVAYWDFTWEEFMNRIPNDAMGLQLLTIRDNFDTFNIRKREWDDWGATAYILKRDYVELLMKNYCLFDNHFRIQIYDPKTNSYIHPVVESAIFSFIGDYQGSLFYANDSMYTMPLFVEDVWNFDTTFIKSPENEKFMSEWKKNNTHQKEQHYESAEIVLNYWKNKGLSYV